MKRMFATDEGQMKRWLAIVSFCVFFTPCVYGETITYYGETITYDGGAKYSGEVEDGIKHGHGIYTFADGSKRVGKWKDDVIWEGIEYWADGSEAGRFKKGEHFPTATCITERSEELLNGGQKVIHRCRNGKYVGKVQNGQRSGHGTFTFNDGNEYIGEWKNGKKHGRGTFTWAEGTEYVGEYKNGKKHGTGRYTWAGGAQYVGAYEDDKKHGHGTYTWAGGTKYVGQWKNNRQRDGILYHRDGTVIGTYSR